MLLEITTARHKYQINLKRRRSVLKGNSGTGKSSIIKFVDNYLRFGKGAGSDVKCDMEFAVVHQSPSRLWFTDHAGELLLVEEDVKLDNRLEFFKCVEEFGCWMLYVSRDYRATGFDCIAYELKTSGNITWNVLCKNLKL